MTTTTNVPAEVMQALADFKAKNGKTWRAKLRSLWNSGKDDGLLRQARNFIGPGSALDKVLR